MLFNIRPLKSTDEVRNEIRKIVARQKKGSADDLTAFNGEIEDLLKLLEFKPEWAKQPVVARALRIEGAEEPGRATPYSQDVVLPNTKHDLQLVVKMLNYLQKKRIPAVRQPLFVQPDEISLARREGRINFDGGTITSQVSVVLQKGAIMYAGFVFGRNYVVLQN